MKRESPQERRRHVLTVLRRATYPDGQAVRRLVARRKQKHSA